jgi:hypothetical protein
MALDHTGDTDAAVETADKPPPIEHSPPPDRPGTEGAPSRAESRTAAAQVNDQASEQASEDETGGQELDSEPDPVSQESPGEQDTQAAPATVEAEPAEPSSEMAGRLDETPAEQEPVERATDGIEGAGQALMPQDTGPPQESVEDGRDPEGAPETTGVPESELGAGAAVEEASVPVGEGNAVQDQLDDRSSSAEEAPAANADAPGSVEPSESVEPVQVEEESPPDPEFAGEVPDAVEVTPEETDPADEKSSMAGVDQSVRPDDASETLDEEQLRGMRKRDEASPEQVVGTGKDRADSVVPTTETGYRPDKTSPAADGGWEQRESNEAGDVGRSAERSDGWGQDEPGSWRGDSGQYLNAEENLVTEHALDRVRGCEPRVTADLNAIERDLSGGELTGLEYRLKGEDRFKEKVSVDTRQKPEMSIGRIAEAVPDAVRYTFRFDKNDYVRGYGQVRQRLEERGYTLVLSRNSWGSPDYKGINTRWRAPQGQTVEVQFHTPESFAAKQETHAAYEKIRSPGISDRERQALRMYQQDVSAHISVPDEVDTIPDYREEEY